MKNIPHLLCLLLLALVLRLGYLPVPMKEAHPFYSNDSFLYVALAKDLRSGYLDPAGPDFRGGLLRTPVYPIFIATIFSLFGSKAIAVVLAQIALFLAILALTYRIAARLFGREAALWGTAWLALDPTTIPYTTLVQPEILFSFLLVGVSLLWLDAMDRKSMTRMAAAGFLLGVTTLTRPITLYLPLVLLCVTWIVLGKNIGLRQRLILSVAFLSMFTIPVGIWILHGMALTGVPSLSTLEGQHLLNYHATGAYAEEHGLTFPEARARIAAMERERLQPHWNPAERSRAQRTLAWKILLSCPWGTVKSSLKGSVRLMIGHQGLSLDNLLGRDKPWLDPRLRLFTRIAGFLILGLMYLGALGGLSLLIRRRALRELAFLLTFLVYFILTSSYPQTDHRLRVPMMPYLAVLAGYGFACIFGKMRTFWKDRGLSM